MRTFSYIPRTVLVGGPPAYTTGFTRKQCGVILYCDLLTPRPSRFPDGIFISKKGERMFRFLFVSVTTLAPTLLHAATCDAGYYLDENAECVICPAGYMCTDGVKNACSGATYQNETGKSLCKTCPVAMQYASDVKTYSYSADYGASGTDAAHTHIGGCLVYFKTDSVADGTFSGLHCYYSPTDGDYGKTNSICGLKSKTCVAGAYSTAGNSTAWISAKGYESMIERACINVGNGYWSPADSLERFACTNAPENATYTSGAESNNCPWLCRDGLGRTAADTCMPLCTAGVTTLNTLTGVRAPLFAVANTVPAIHIKNANGTCHADLIPSLGKNALHIRYNGQVYHTMNVNK